MEKRVYLKKTWELDGDCALLAEFTSGVISSFVDLFSYETTPEVYHLRIYLKEFDGLKKVIEDFMDYVERVDTQEHVQLGFMPVGILRGTDPKARPLGGTFMVDCSRCHTWLLVRFRRDFHPEEGPKTVMEKERYYPIQLAFKVVDFPMVRDLLKDMSCFFKEEIKQKHMMLLEKRLTTPSGDRISEITFKRRITPKPCMEFNRGCEGEEPEI